MSQFVKPPTGKSFRFVRACERARDQRFDCAARAVVRQTTVLSFFGQTVPGGLSTKNLVLAQVFSRFSRTTLLKPM